MYDGYPDLAPVRSAAPAALFTLDEVKQHLRVDGDDEDDKIEAFIAAAIGYVDGWTGVLGRCLMEQTWVAYYPDFGCTRLRLPLRPITSITSLKYYDSSNVQQTWGASNYRLLTDYLSPYVTYAVNGSWPTSLVSREDAVSITFKSGYADAASVPTAIKQALLLIIGDWYENRENLILGPSATIKIPVAAEHLLAPHKAGSF